MVAFELRNDFPDHQEQTLRRNGRFVVVSAAVEIDENLKIQEVQYTIREKENA